MENLQEKRELRIPFKKRKAPWYLCFQAILEKAQNNCEVPDEIAKYTNKYFEKYVSNKELKDSITLNSPVPKTVPKAKNMDDYFVELLEDQRKKEIALDDTFKKLQSKTLTIMRPLRKV